MRVVSLSSRKECRVDQYLNRPIDRWCLHDVTGFRRTRYLPPCRMHLPKVVTAGAWTGNCKTAGGGGAGGVDVTGVGMQERLLPGSPSCSVGGSWTSPKGRRRTEGIRVLFPRRCVAGSASSVAHVAKGRACRSRNQALLASWADGSVGGSEGEPPSSAPSTPTASTSANLTSVPLKGK